MQITIDVTDRMMMLARRRRDLIQQAESKLTHEQAKKIWGELVEIEGELSRDLCYDILNLEMQS